MSFFTINALFGFLVFGAASMALAQTGSSTPPLPAASAPAGAAVGQNAQSLSAAQQAKVKSVLAPYSSATLSADDAKQIKRTLRDAGMPRSPALDTALAAAGFSPARLDQLDPPPPRPADGHASPPPQTK